MEAHEDGGATAPASRGERILALDAIRGCLALGIMVYHVLSWSDVARITTLGTYGVYAFFVLSGFALEHVYGPRLRDVAGLRRYAAARLARIFPLYTLIALLAATLLAIRGGDVDLGRVALNVGLLFGFVDPGATSTVTGGWSIGIEVVFYVLFPIVAVTVRSIRGLTVLALGTLALHVVYVEAVWPQGASLQEVWVPYTRFPTFACYFLGGMLAARVARDRRRPLPALLALGLAAAPMAVVVAVSVAALPDRAVFAGGGGLLLVLLCIATIWIPAFGQPIRGRVADVSRWLGDISYATYLLHPIVWTTLGMGGVGVVRRTVLTLALTPLVAYLVHRAVEVPLGRRLREALGSRPSARPDPAGVPRPSEA